MEREREIGVCTFSRTCDTARPWGRVSVGLSRCARDSPVVALEAGISARSQQWGSGLAGPHPLGLCSFGEMSHFVSPRLNLLTTK